MSEDLLKLVPEPMEDDVNTQVPPFKNLEEESNIRINLKETSTPLFLEKPRKHYNAGRNRKRIIVVGSSGKGGTGKSTTSVLMALAYQKKNDNTVIVDFDLPIGDVPTMLGMSYERSISDFYDVPDDLSDEKVRENLLLTYHNGLKVLPALRDLQDMSLVNTGWFVEKLIHHLKSFDVIVVDTGPNFEEATLKLFEMATDIVYVTDDYETTFHNIYQGRCLLEYSGVDVSKIRLAVNRSQDSKQERVSFISNTTAIQNVFFLPYVKEMPNLVDSKDYNVLKQKNHFYNQSLEKLMEHLTPELYGTGMNIEEDKRQPGFFARLFKRGVKK
ncbi:CpaE family protein [Pseudobacillus sp. 179-B 2D1 NHS]|uniref:CpaE family protein n=1 Tax=Pseudobacillus sp. 179-B 2D1 NHS TaxID=3374292 RepID=UPI003878FC76